MFWHLRLALVLSAFAFSISPANAGNPGEEDLSKMPGRNIYMNPLECDRPLVATPARDLKAFGCPHCGNPLSMEPQENGNIIQCIACAIYMYPSRVDNERIQIQLQNGERFVLRSTPHPGAVGYTFSEINFEVDLIKVLRSITQSENVLGRDVFTGEPITKNIYWALLKTHSREQSIRIATLFPAFSVQFHQEGIALPVGPDSMLKLSHLIHLISRSRKIDADMIFEASGVVGLGYLPHEALVQARTIEIEFATESSEFNGPFLDPN